MTIQEGSDSGISLKPKRGPSRIKILSGSSESSLSQAWKRKGQSSSAGIEIFVEAGGGKCAERAFSSSGDCSKKSVHFLLFSAFAVPEQLLPYAEEKNSEYKRACNYTTVDLGNQLG